MQAWQRVMDIQMENIGEYGDFHNKEMSRCIFIKALQENGKTIRTDHEKILREYYNKGFNEGLHVGAEKCSEEMGAGTATILAKDESLKLLKDDTPFLKWLKDEILNSGVTVKAGMTTWTGSIST